MNVRGLMVGFCASLFVMTLNSCNSDADVPDDLERWNAEVAQIDADLQNTPNVLEDPVTGIRIVVTNLGTGLPAQPWNLVTVDYVGRRYADKVLFDQGTIDAKLLSGFIPGWQIALSKLPAGSEGKVIIPSIYGYGSAGYGSIPGNTILEFDIKFKKVTLSSSNAQRLNTDTLAIDNYLQGKGITAQKDTSGVRYVITKAGSGSNPGWFNRLKLKYTIRLLTDDTHEITTIEREPSDDFYSRPIDFIHGMKIGLQKLTVGSTAVFYVPSGYAFGPEGATNNSGTSIPGNANIIVEVELTDILE